MDKDKLISDLSPHLFWDVDRNSLDKVKNRKWLVGRVLEYGLLKDWKIICAHYGMNEIAIIARELKNLDKRTISLISVLAKISKEELSCYTTTQSTPGYLNL